MKYTLYRTLGNIEKQITKHELIAVEYGKDIYEVTEILMQAVDDDLSTTPEYTQYETSAYEPELLKEKGITSRYDYRIIGIASPLYANENTLIDYGVFELEE